MSLKILPRLKTPTANKRIDLDLPKSSEEVSCITARLNENFKQSIVISNNVALLVEEDYKISTEMHDKFDKEYTKLKKNLCQLVQQIRFPTLSDLERVKESSKEK